MQSYAYRLMIYKDAPPGAKKRQIEYAEVALAKKMVEELPLNQPAVVMKTQRDVYVDGITVADGIEIRLYAVAIPKPNKPSGTGYFASHELEQQYAEIGRTVVALMGIDTKPVLHRNAVEWFDVKD